MQLPKDLAADAVVAVQSSSAAILAIAAADRIPCGRDTVAAADAADASDEYLILPFPFFSPLPSPPLPNLLLPLHSPCTSAVLFVALLLYPHMVSISLLSPAPSSTQTLHPLSFHYEVTCLLLLFPVLLSPNPLFPDLQDALRGTCNAQSPPLLAPNYV